MWSRVLTLLRARLAAQQDGASAPVAALMMQTFIAAVLCGIVRGELPPFAYGVFALSVSAVLVAVPLLGEFGGLLTRDEAEQWVRSLPVTERDIRLARLLHVLLALAMLSLGSLVPAALLADGRIGLVGRFLLIACGLAQSLLIAAVLLLAMSVLRGRAQALLVLLQTALFAGAIVGAAFGLRHVERLVTLDAPSGPGWAWLPPAWFAAPLASAALPTAWRLAAPLAALGAALLILLQPAPSTGIARRGEPLLTRLLTPLRALARRIWVRRDERALFELVFEALPKERDFVLRTYPLLGIPLAFLATGAQGSDSDEKRGLLALLLFTPGTYLPILIAHIPASASYRARWLLDGAPVDRAAIENGALKAVAVRFLAPLFILLGLLCWSLAGASFALRMVPPAFLVSLIILRQLYKMMDIDTPLSVPPEELAARQNWFNAMLGLALILTIVAMMAQAWIDSLAIAAVVTAVLLAAEFAQDRAWRSARESE